MYKDEIMQTIGENLLRFRLERGYTQEQLSELVGISTSFYANLERGKKGMSILVLRNLADVLGVSVDSLLYPSQEKAHLHNIESMLSNVPDSFVASIEKIVRACKDEFLTENDGTSNK
jgi:transcriptional regulator with XRE-family HTH domain